MRWAVRGPPEAFRSILFEVAIEAAPREDNDALFRTARKAQHQSVEMGEALDSTNDAIIGARGAESNL